MGHGLYVCLMYRRFLLQNLMKITVHIMLYAPTTSVVPPLLTVCLINLLAHFTLGSDSTPASVRT